MPSTDRLKISLAQLNPTVGDIAGNAAKLGAALATARGQGADLLVTPELFLAGHPAEDLVLRPDFIDAVEAAVERLRPETAAGTALLVGVPWRHEGRTYDAALLLERGELRAVRFKHDLSNDGAFDEKRVFAAGPPPGPVAFRGVRLGVMIGDDVRSPDVAETLEESGAQLLIVLDGAPFEADRQDERIQLAVQRVRESGLALLAVNQVGGQDELVFDGGSFALDRQYRLRLQAPSWREAVVPTDWRLDDDERWVIEHGPMTAPEEGPAAVYQALVLGLRDYATKNGWPGAVVGLSGDLPSALAAAIAVDALGPERVHGLAMPDRETPADRVIDAIEGARLLGLAPDTIDIAPAVEAIDAILGAGRRSAMRGLVLAGHADERGWLGLSTIDKSALALGRGDRGGDYAVLKDVYGTAAPDLARWRNGTKPAGALGPVGPVVPDRVLVAPTAEAVMLDDILACLVEREMAADAIAARGHAPETVTRVWRMLDRAEYKRRQAPPGVKTTRRAFGRDRRYPITNSFQGG